MSEGRRIVFATRLVVLSIAVAAAAAQPAAAQTCEPCVFDEPLVEPFEIKSVNGVLDTSLRIELKTHKVPVWEFNGSWQCCQRAMTLRTYGHPVGPGFKFDFPGPTLRLRKPSPASTAPGDRLRLLLVNALPLASDEVCDPGCNCNQEPQPKCCQDADEHPNCFHGQHDEPPLPRQPRLAAAAAGLRAPRAAAARRGVRGAPAHGRGVEALGSFQFDVDPLRYRQSEGTHWYHPHKHGSVAQQVGDGMAGALIIAGPFDDWLQQFYARQGGLDEKVLVVQQVHQLNFLAPRDLPAAAPGQRPDRPQDHHGPGRDPALALRRRHHPGRRADHHRLQRPEPGAARRAQADRHGRRPVRARELRPAAVPVGRPPGVRPVAGEPGRLPGAGAARARDLPRHLRRLRARRGPGRREALRSLLEFLGPGGEEPTLLTVEVVPCPGCRAMTFPTVAQWPPLPPYLADIGPLPTRERQLYFALEDLKGDPGFPAQQPTKFYIGLAEGEDRQLDPDCVDVTVGLGTAEQWRIHNNLSLGGTPFHVFHIHTNPFQLLQSGTATFAAPYPWMDSITLADMTAGPTVIRHRFDDFTGEYVLHCHFLGHEDRGMMLGVQAVCPNRRTPSARRAPTAGRSACPATTSRRRRTARRHRCRRARRSPCATLAPSAAKKLRRRMRATAVCL